MPQASNPEVAVIAKAAAPARTWDGEAIEPFDEDYDDYLDSMPTKEDLRLFPRPIYYWEVAHPGCALQPFPRMGSFNSADTGLWSARNKAQQKAIREYIQISTHLEPDLLRLTPEETAYQTGDKVPIQGVTRFCQDCHFITTSLLASGLHEELTGHTTKSKPRIR